MKKGNARTVRGRKKTRSRRGVMNAVDVTGTFSGGGGEVRFLGWKGPGIASADRSTTKAVFPSGASSRSKARDYTLLVPESLNAIVDRHQFGIEQGHARGNWQKGKDDPDFVRDRVNHLFEHILAVVTGVHPRGEDGLPRPANSSDVDACLCNLQMIAWYQHNGTGLEIAFPHLLPTKEGK